tara:strand:+ start:1210 stop:1674 length:465 start_codon:yes stop_codon:yes gene_type:complete
MYLKRLTFIIIIIFYSLPALSELIKPNNGIDPIQVVKIQLRGLMNNDNPSKDSGIEQTWEFAHPNNQRYTGPLNKFKTMLKGDSYSMLLNHKEHKVIEIYSTQEVAMYEVTIMDQNKKYFKFQWKVEKYKSSGPLKNCWLTTSVSQPLDMGSSI